jgi:hypothetical protein
MLESSPGDVIVGAKLRHALAGALELFGAGHDDAFPRGINRAGFRT